MGNLPRAMVSELWRFRISRAAAVVNQQAREHRESGSRMSDQQQDPTITDSLAVLAGGGEMGQRTRSFDWSKTQVGPIAGWPQALKTVVRVDARVSLRDVARLGA